MGRTNRYMQLCKHYLQLFQGLLHLSEIWNMLIETGILPINPAEHDVGYLYNDPHPIGGTPEYNL